MSKENEHVAEEIRKSGFPLEIEVADILQRHGWEVIPSSFFYDYDTEEYREIDILAYNHVGTALKGSANYPYRITMGLVLECKKREDTALVFFPRPRDPNDLDYGGVGLASVDSFRIARISSLLASHPSLTTGPLRRETEFGLEPKAFVPATIAREIWGATEIANFVQARDFRCHNYVWPVDDLGDRTPAEVLNSKVLLNVNRWLSLIKRATEANKGDHTP